MKYFLLIIGLFCFDQSIIAQTNTKKIVKIAETGKPTIEYLYDKKGRLITVKENAQVEKTIHYDDAGRVKAIRFYQKKKIVHTDTNFVYTSTGKRVSFDRIFPGYSTDKFSFSYDNNDRITKRRIDKYRVSKKEGAAIPWEELTYSYNGNTVSMEKKETSFGGIIGYTYIYEFDNKGNILSLTEKTNVETDSPKHIITGYDDHPRISLPDEWIDRTFPQSANNHSRYQWNEKRYETFAYTYNPDGSVNGYTYFYQGNDLSLTRKIKITYSK
ncbi:MAG TPA: hypothetical protein VHM26_00145 [Chitinophagaceae bacterium]|jgi:YD repeat-containing protein|nr:hypothetical protein [Chitinophagaceae bacterium]